MLFLIIIIALMPYPKSINKGLPSNLHSLILFFLAKL